eukprot:scaffold50088_cov32-Tisochrysis_lutea.AAC.4
MTISKREEEREREEKTVGRVADPRPRERRGAAVSAVVPRRARLARRLRRPPAAGAAAPRVHFASTPRSSTLPLRQLALPMRNEDSATAWEPSCAARPRCALRRCRSCMGRI